MHKHHGVYCIVHRLINRKGAFCDKLSRKNLYKIDGIFCAKLIEIANQMFYTANWEIF